MQLYLFASLSLEKQEISSTFSEMGRKVVHVAARLKHSPTTETKVKPQLGCVFQQKQWQRLG